MLPDMHVPNEDKKSLGAVLVYAATLRLDYCIILGDFIDCGCISRFVEGVPGEILDQKLLDEFIAGQAVIGKIVATVRKKNKQCEIYLLEGNHEYRIIDYGNKHLGMRGLLDVERNLDLKKRDIKWVPFWSNKQKNVLKIGKATFIHGCWCNKYHAAKHVDEYWGQGVFYGHTHDVQEYSKSFSGHDETVRAKSLGCLCNYEQQYLKGRTTKWQQAFGVFQFFPDGKFQDNVIPIYNHRFVGLNGKVYGEASRKNDS